MVKILILWYTKYSEVQNQGDGPHQKRIPKGEK